MFPGCVDFADPGPHLEKGGSGMLDPGGSPESPVFLSLFSRCLQEPLLFLFHGPPGWLLCSGRSYRPFLSPLGCRSGVFSFLTLLAVLLEATLPS